MSNWSSGEPSDLPSDTKPDVPRGVQPDMPPSVQRDARPEVWRDAPPSVQRDARPEVNPEVPSDVLPGADPDALADVLLERVAPVADPLADFFWRSGADGVLRILRCADCGYYVHPPSTPCPRCLSAKVAPEPVSGRGVVHTFTVNVQQWQPGQPPYVIAIVELAEQDGLRLTTSVLGCGPDEVHIDQPVRVDFVARDELYYPVFRPAERL